MRLRSALPTLLLLALLAGCEMLGIDSPERLAALKEGEGKAIGSACRHATRAIEDCYTLYPKAQKSAVFAGWREMDEYMRENKLEGVRPTIARAEAPPATAGDDAPARPAGTPARKSTAAAGAKTVHES